MMVIVIIMIFLVLVVVSIIVLFPVIKIIIFSISEVINAGTKKKPPPELDPPKAARQIHDSGMLPQKGYFFNDKNTDRQAKAREFQVPQKAGT